MDKFAQPEPWANLCDLERRQSAPYSLQIFVTYGRTDLNLWSLVLIKLQIFQGDIDQPTEHYDSILNIPTVFQTTFELQSRANTLGMCKNHSMRVCSEFLVFIIIINLLAQKHDKVTCATKQIERDSKDTDATNSCPRKVLVRNTLQK